MYDDGSGGVDEDHKEREGGEEGTVLGSGMHRYARSCFSLAVLLLP